MLYLTLELDFIYYTINLHCIYTTLKCDAEGYPPSVSGGYISLMHLSACGVILVVTSTYKCLCLCNSSAWYSGWERDGGGRKGDRGR